MFRNLENVLPTQPSTLLTMDPATNFVKKFRIHQLNFESVLPTRPSTPLIMNHISNFILLKLNVLACRRFLYIVTTTQEFETWRYKLFSYARRKRRQILGSRCSRPNCGMACSQSTRKIVSPIIPASVFLGI
jgi:hypothetical protein